MIAQDHGLQDALDNRLIALCRSAIDKGTPVSLDLPIRNVNRTVGTMLGSEVTRKHGGAGLPPAAPPQPPAAAQTVAPAPDAQTPPAGKHELKPAAKPVPRQANPPPAGENPTDDQ